MANSKLKKFNRSAAILFVVALVLIGNGLIVTPSFGATTKKTVKTTTPAKTPFVKLPPLPLQFIPFSKPLTVAGIVHWTNVYRTANNSTSTALSENTLLDKISAARAADMFKRQYFDHIDPKGVTPGDVARKMGYDYLSEGENIARGIYYDDETLVDAWMASPHHRENILNGKFEEIGVGIATGTFQGYKTWIIVQTFGRPISDCATPPAKIRKEIEQNNSDLAEMTQNAKLLYSAIVNYTPHTTDEVTAYNEKVGQYNALVSQISTLSTMNEELLIPYNEAVRVYNSCLLK